MKFIFRLLGLLVLAGIGFLAWRHYFPNDRELIFSMFDRLAKSASVPAKPTAVSGLMASDRVRDSFSTNIEVSVDVPGAGRMIFNDREDIVQACQAAWARTKDVKIEFCDINFLSSGDGMAKVELTARGSRPSERDFYLQQFRIDLRKQDDKWRIIKVVPFDVFK